MLLGNEKFFGPSQSILTERRDSSPLSRGALLTIWVVAASQLRATAATPTLFEYLQPSLD